MISARTSLTFGTQHRLQLFVIEPFFEESNRCRRMIVQMLRALDAARVGSTIAELPGCGESTTPIENVTFADWQNAVAGLVQTGRFQAIASFRGGALLEGQDALPVWRFSPETGQRLARDLERTRLAGSSDLYAGHRLSTAFLADLRIAMPPTQAKLRTVRLETDAAEADAKVAGSPLWRRAEPGEDQGLSETLAADIAHWLQYA